MTSPRSLHCHKQQICQSNLSGIVVERFKIFFSTFTSIFVVLKFSLGLVIILLRTPLGWEPKAHWCSRAGQETARRRRSDRSPVKLSFESQPPLLADVSKPAFPCARDYIPLLFLFMFCYCCHSLNRYAVYKT